MWFGEGLKSNHCERGMDSPLYKRAKSHNVITLHSERLFNILRLNPSLVAVYFVNWSFLPDRVKAGATCLINLIKII